MPIPISDRLFIDYLRCKYKAYLKFSGKSGVKSDFEIYQDDKHTEYRQRARELRAERNTEPFILTGTFKDVKKQNLFIAIIARTSIAFSISSRCLIRLCWYTHFPISPAGCHLRTKTPGYSFS